MIQNRTDLMFYISMDQKSYGRKSKIPHFFYDETWKFQLSLRFHEYHANQHGLFHKLCALFWGYMHHYYGIKMGWSIPINTFGPGLKINHYGLIVVNDLARIGSFCDIHQGVNIGQHGPKITDVPIIGDNVWIGPGAKHRRFFSHFQQKNCQIMDFLCINRIICVTIQYRKGSVSRVSNV